MLDQIRRMAVFATVVQHGSLGAAARQLQTSTSAVSQQLRALERDLGITLLHRSTRRLALTTEGARFHAGCAAMLAAATQAQEQLAQARDAPEGELRISAPVGFAKHLGPALDALLRAHPNLRLHLEVEDRFTDLLARRIDLAIRFGRLPDSPWTAQRIGEKRMGLFAAPRYLSQLGLPREMDDLRDADWLMLGEDCEARSAPFGLSLTLRPRISCNNQLSLQQLCEAGQGLAVLSLEDVAGAVQAGRLLRLLPEWPLPVLPIYAVVPQRDAQPAKVRHAIAALKTYLASASGERNST
ncbi:DNA-binding transcriptional LysR family regulator [Inhella inkyongensis]|uniref:DNA-binding transcriptional LysR family regulator n=1 Tax=Inhella inkyongensis TaxID=392593 RepID=A0A840SA77_9BURK|nr:LysR family transcriptional regulator [Inhella inkyongensis]MBB5205684.1 DNA-binding transcriptional LysR family regulator [Inhella inkyongensis]